MDEIKDAPTLLARVQQYYGQVLKSSADLQTSACCAAEAMPAALWPLLADMHTANAAIHDRYAPASAHWLAPLLVLLGGNTLADTPPVDEARPPPLIPVEAFATLPLAADLQLSPDGDRLAMRINRNGRFEIATFNYLEPGALVRTIPFRSSDRRWYRWVDNDRLLIADPSLGLLQTSLFLYDIPAGSLETLTRPALFMTEADILFIADDGSHLLLQRYDPEEPWAAVFRVDIASGEETEVMPPTEPMVRWIADADGEIRAGMALERDGYTLRLRDSTGAPFRTALTFEGTPGASDFQVVIPLSGRPGFVLTNTRTGRFGVYAFDLAAQAVGEPVFEHPEVDVDGFTQMPDGSGVEAVFYAVDRDKVNWIDPHMRQVQAAIDAALPGRINRIESSDRKRNRFVVFSTSAGDPGEYHVYQHEPRSVGLLNRPYEALHKARLAVVEPVRYSSRDGLTIRGYLTLPAGREPQGLPLVVLPHGGPHWRNRWQYDPLVQLLANRGYAVLQPNFRGSTGFGREFLEAGFGQYGAGMIDDIADGARWLADRGIADPARICIMGASYGGYAAMMAPIREPGLWRCSISFAGPVDWQHQLRHERRRLAPPWYRQLEQQLRGSPRANLRHQSPVQRAGELDVPLLLVHGRRDRVVPISHAERMSRALRRGRKEFEFMEMPDTGHDFLTEAAYGHFLGAVESFLARHNPADTVAAVD